MKLYSYTCTNPGCRCGNPLLPKYPEGHRSRMWSYCDACYVRIFPKASVKKRLTKVAKSQPTITAERCSMCSGLYDPSTVANADMLLCQRCY